MGLGAGHLTQEIAEGKNSPSKSLDNSPFFPSFCGIFTLINPDLAFFWCPIHIIFFFLNLFSDFHKLQTSVYKHVEIHLKVTDVQRVPQQSSSRPTDGHLLRSPSSSCVRPMKHSLISTLLFWTLVCRKKKKKGDRGPRYVINTAGGWCLLTTNLTHLPLPSFIHGDKHLWG